MIIVILAVFLFSIISVLRKQNTIVLLCLTFFLTNGYQFFSEESFVIKPTDYLLALTLLISFVNKKPGYFKIGKDKIALLFLLLLIYQTIELLRTIFFQYETIKFSIQVARINIIYLLYFYIRSLSIHTLKKFIEINLLFTLFIGLFFYLQIIGLTGILVGRVDDPSSSNGYVRYANFPQFAIFYFFYILSNNKYTVVTKIILCVFFAMMPVLGMYRSTIIAMSIASIAYFLIIRGRQSIPLLIICTVLSVLVIKPVFDTRSGNDGSVKNDIENIFNSEIDNIGKNEGTFSFRIAMLAERILYLVENPQFALIGVGDIHEESPNCTNRFNFFVGTTSLTSDTGRGQIETGDITWVPITLRYGGIGVIIYVMILYLWGKLSITNMKLKKGGEFMASSLLFVVFVFISFSTTLFENYLRLFMMLISITVLMRNSNSINAS